MRASLENMIRVKVASGQHMMLEMRQASKDSLLDHEYFSKEITSMPETSQREQTSAQMNEQLMQI